MRFTVEENPQGGDYTLLPQGSYVFEIKSAGESIAAKDDAVPQLALILEVAEGNQTGEQIRIWLTKSEKAAWRLKNLCQACDPDETIHTCVPMGKNEKGLEKFDLDIPGPDEDFVGLFFIGDCNVKANNKGKKYTNVKEFLPLMTGETETKQENLPEQPAEQPPLATSVAETAAVQQQATEPSISRRQPARRARTR